MNVYLNVTHALTLSATTAGYGFMLSYPLKNRGQQTEKMFINLSHQVGACAYAPTDCARTVIEAATCLQCAKCLLYHCMSDTEGNYVHPCECSNSDGHWARRWIGLSLLSILVPCLCCYVPLMACYKCGRICNLCGGRHEAQ